MPDKTLTKSEKKNLACLKGLDLIREQHKFKIRLCSTQSDSYLYNLKNLLVLLGVGGKTS